MARAVGAMAEPYRRMTAVATDLAKVRRLEALGFRAWPADGKFIEGTWMVRLTPGHPSFRLNSINPLDPGDLVDFEERTALVAPRFEDVGRNVVFRLSPLAPRALVSHLDRNGWPAVKPSLVMCAELAAMPLDEAITQIPLRDIRRFVDAAAIVHGYEAPLRHGLEKVVSAIGPEAGLFLLEVDGQPLSSAICVCDGSFAGLLEVATHASARGQGYGRRLVLSALKWARMRGASIGWLQVEAANQPARTLYGALGFQDVYGYDYRTRPA